MKTDYKKGLFTILFVVLILPFVQQCMPFINSGKLFGFYSDSPDVTFSLEKWWNGEYQKGKGNYCNDHIGFRPDMLRVNGQIDYSLFYKVNYGGTCAGKSDYLFYENYLTAYYGLDYAGLPKLQTQMFRLKALQDTFAHLDKSLILVFTPCKAWYCSNYLPDHKKPDPNRLNNYTSCIRLGDSLGINMIDFNSWFLKLRDTTRELLYPKQGIHWTNYGSVLAGDSLIKYIENLRHIRLPQPCWVGVKHTTEPQDPDNDMGNILNLIWPVVKENFCYPEVKFIEDSFTTHLNAIHIGDSYNINLLRTGMLQKMYGDNWQFWFGFKHIFNSKTYKEWTYPQVKDIDWIGELLKADCIIILNTPRSADELGSGFIDSAYNYFYPGK